jgi:hypothetical protein
MDIQEQRDVLLRRAIFDCVEVSEGKITWHYNRALELITAYRRELETRPVSSSHTPHQLACYLATGHQGPCNGAPRWDCPPLKEQKRKEALAWLRAAENQLPDGEPLSCPECGGTKITTQRFAKLAIWSATEPGERIVVPLRQCGDCMMMWFDYVAEDIEEAAIQRRRADQLRKTATRPEPALDYVTRPVTTLENLRASDVPRGLDPDDFVTESPFKVWVTLTCPACQNRSMHSLTQESAEAESGTLMEYLMRYAEHHSKCTQETAGR